MTTITAELNGKPEDLKMVLACGIKYNSTEKLDKNTLIVSWICKESDYDKAFESSLDSVDLRELELWNVELKNIA